MWEEEEDETTMVSLRDKDISTGEGLDGKDDVVRMKEDNRYKIHHVYCGWEGR